MGKRAPGERPLQSWGSKGDPKSTKSSAPRWDSRSPRVPLGLTAPCWNLPLGDKRSLLHLCSWLREEQGEENEELTEPMAGSKGCLANNLPGAAKPPAPSGEGETRANACFGEDFPASPRREPAGSLHIPSQEPPSHVGRGEKQELMFSNFGMWRKIPPGAASEPSAPPGRLLGWILHPQPLLWVMLVDKNQRFPLTQGSFCLQKAGGEDLPRVQAHGEEGTAPAKLRKQPR